MKAHIAIHVALDGTETVLASGLDGDPVVNAYKGCTEPGKVYYFVAADADKTKRYHPGPVAETFTAPKVRKNK